MTPEIDNLIERCIALFVGAQSSLYSVIRVEVLPSQKIFGSVPTLAAELINQIKNEWMCSEMLAL